MYKTKIQQLCHSRSWNLPDYETMRDGPDHNPRFISTVTVNGLQFHSPEPTRSSKEAQNNAAELAFHHFTQPFNPNPNPNPNPLLSLPHLSSFPGCSFPQPSLSISPASSTTSTTTPSLGSFDPNNGGVLRPDTVEGLQTSQICSPVKATTMTAVDQKNMQHLYKNQLQNYAHKKNLNLPAYSSEWEGPPHALRFKCKVTIDGQTFESSKFFSTLKDAEHAAAEIALMSLSPGGVQEDQTGLYKNLLQEFVQKEGFRLPSYNTNRYGESHMPTFVSQVEIEGESFTGQEAKSKKQAETSAAKVAYMTLKERKGMSDQSPLFPLSAHCGQAPEFSSDRSEANVITGLQPHANLKSPVSPGLVAKNQLDKSKELIEKKGSCSSGNSNGFTKSSSLTNAQSEPSLSESTNVASDTSKMLSTQGTTPCRIKVIVYSRNTNVEIEGGGSMMHISDDKWVAYSFSH
ncbi:putative double-stranded RNA-binding domain-containing protein [Lupinus albus]|uniref:Putative double-stranded RNA-binding domain-containing protein n=1 Tax=Lupinus albus TaxID=3870 RepID=A0A6A4QYF2_LUPAL|nr:putative double-stranded RNA-binding domain-containing protein [Lupinus albus]